MPTSYGHNVAPVSGLDWANFALESTAQIAKTFGALEDSIASRRKEALTSMLSFMDYSNKAEDQAMQRSRFAMDLDKRRVEMLGELGNEQLAEYLLGEANAMGEDLKANRFGSAMGRYAFLFGKDGAVNTYADDLQKPGRLPDGTLVPPSFPQLIASRNAVDASPVGSQLVGMFGKNDVNPNTLSILRGVLEKTSGADEAMSLFMRTGHDPWELGYDPDTQTISDDTDIQRRITAAKQAALSGSSRYEAYDQLRIAHGMRAIGVPSARGPTRDSIIDVPMMPVEIGGNRVLQMPAPLADLTARMSKPEQIANFVAQLADMGYTITGMPALSDDKKQVYAMKPPGGNPRDVNSVFNPISIELVRQAYAVKPELADWSPERVRNLGGIRNVAMSFVKRAYAESGNTMPELAYDPNAAAVTFGQEESGFKKYISATGIQPDLSAKVDKLVELGVSVKDAAKVDDSLESIFSSLGAGLPEAIRQAFQNHASEFVVDGSRDIRDQEQSRNEAAVKAFAEGLNTIQKQFDVARGNVADQLASDLEESGVSIPRGITVDGKFVELPVVSNIYGKQIDWLSATRGTGLSPRALQEYFVGSVLRGNIPMKEQGFNDLRKTVTDNMSIYYRHLTEMKRAGRETNAIFGGKRPQFKASADALWAMFSSMDMSGSYRGAVENAKLAMTAPPFGVIAAEAKIINPDLYDEAVAKAEKWIPGFNGVQ